MDLQAALQQRAKVEEFQRKHRVGLLTLLFTDLVGSTKLKQDLGDHVAVNLIQRHHALVREILSQFNEGEEIDTAGDSFFIVFAKPSDALRFSLLLQSRLRQLAKETPRPLMDRIGLHIGEVMIEEHPEGPKPKDLYGLQVDICARVMSLAEGDQILMTRSAFDNARQVLKGQEVEGVAGLSWLNHGPYVLKGVEEPLEICEVGEVGQAVLKAPPDSEKVHRHVSPDAEPVLGWRPAINQAVPGTEWALVEKLGEGGFGEVWLGTHRKLKDKRVFKFCFRADRVRPLKREVTLFRLLKERIGEHPNIVRVHDVFFDEPPYYLMMDYVEGGDLGDWCEAQGGVEKVALATRLEIVAQVADALQAAHDAGVIHRDVKPSNILLGQLSTPNPKLTAKLTDFGIGQVVSQEALAGMTKLGFTQTMMSPGSSVQTGTQLYMAPELIAGKSASIQSDVYALGVVLYQLLAGDLSRPMSMDWPRDIEEPRLVDELTKCFAGNPSERFASCREFAEALRAIKRRAAFLARRRKVSNVFGNVGYGALFILGVLVASSSLSYLLVKIMRLAHVVLLPQGAPLLSPNPQGTLPTFTLIFRLGLLAAGAFAIYAAVTKYKGVWPILMGGFCLLVIPLAFKSELDQFVHGRGQGWLQIASVLLLVFVVALTLISSGYKEHQSTSKRLKTSTLLPHKPLVGVALSVFANGAAHFLAGKRELGLLWFLGLTLLQYLFLWCIASPFVPGVLLAIIVGVVFLVLWVVMLATSYRSVPRLKLGVWLMLILAFAILPLVQGTLPLLFFQPFYLSTSSMDPTLMGEKKLPDGSRTEGDRIVVEKYAYWLTKPKRGDIVAFRTTGIPMLPQNHVYVKRVVGIPGDALSVEGGRLLNHGSRIESPPALTALRVFPVPGQIQVDPAWRRVELDGDAYTVGDEGYFVIGDNTVNSFDSRFWGPLPQKAIIGRVSKIFWPLARARAVGVPNPDRSTVVTNNLPGRTQP